MKKAFTILVGIVAAVAASAQTIPTLLIPTDAESLALAGATVALEPAAKGDIEATYGMWAPKTAANNIVGLDAYFHVSDKFALMVDGSYFMDKPYNTMTAQGGLGNTFTPHEMLFGLGGAFKATENVSVAIKAKMFMSTIASDYSGNAFGADVAVKYGTDAFSVALAACNLGSSLTYGSSKTSVPMPMMAKLGGMYTNSGFTVNGEVDYMFCGALMAGLGAEYMIQDLVALRAGYHYGDKEKALASYFALGMGVRVYGVKLDLTYLLASKTLGNTLMFGLGYAF